MVVAQNPVSLRMGTASFARKWNGIARGRVISACRNLRQCWRFYLCPLGLTTPQCRRRIISGSKEGMLSELLTGGAAEGGISNLGRMRAVAPDSRRQRQED